MGLYAYIFYGSMALSVAAAAAILWIRHPMHAALSLLISVLSLALVYMSLHAPLVAVLQVMIYAGAILVMILFLVMILDMRAMVVVYRGKGLYLTAVFMLAMVCFWLLSRVAGVTVHDGGFATFKTVGETLFGAYIPVVESLAMLLLGALVAVLYLSRRYTASRGQPQGGRS